MNTSAEADENTQRRDTVRSDLSLRIETEQAETPEVCRTELKLWIRRAFAYLWFFIIIQITTLCNTPFDPALLPLFVLDLKIVLSAFCSTNLNSFSKLIFSKEIIHQLCSLAFKLMLLAYRNFKIFSSILLIIPLAIAFLNELINKASKSQECKYVVWIIMMISEFLFLLTILNMSLETEKIINWQPSAILWPVYVGLCLCGVLITGMLLFTLGSFLSWANGDIPLREFTSSVWLLFTLLGVSVSTILFCVKATNYGPDMLKNYVFTVPIVFLMVFVVVTQVWISKISDWCVGFFTESSAVESFDLPIPQSTPVRIMTFQSRVSDTIKNVPKVMMRVSSSYFKPAEMKVGKGKTLSLVFEGEETWMERRRNFSNPLDVLEFSPTASESAGKLCEMCCERFCNAVIMDCGHGGICYECSLEMWKGVGFCHMCRGEISQVLKIEKCNKKFFKVHSATRTLRFQQDNS